MEQFILLQLGNNSVENSSLAAAFDISGALIALGLWGRSAGMDGDVSRFYNLKFNLLWT